MTKGGYGGPRTHLDLKFIIKNRIVDLKFIDLITITSYRRKM